MTACFYIRQISDAMSRRILELQEKVRTPKCDDTELEFRDNLEDLRLLVAKEYSCIIMGRLSIPITKCLKKYISSLIDHHKILLFLGGGDIAKYHHMGLSKKLRSLSKRDSILFESILRISIQIIWLALGRKSYNQIGKCYDVCRDFVLSRQ